MKTYKSLEKVREDLKILALEKEIDKEKFILSVNRTKENLEISPMKLLKDAATNAATNVAGTVTKKAIFVGLFNKVFKFKK